MRKHHNPLAAYFRSEFKRLLDGEKSGPVIVVDAPASAPAVQGRETLWGEMRYADPVPMSTPPCLCAPDSAAGQARRFNHARFLLQKLCGRPGFGPDVELR